MRHEDYCTAAMACAAHGTICAAREQSTSQHPSTRADHQLLRRVALPALAATVDMCAPVEDGPALVIERLDALGLVWEGGHESGVELLTRPAHLPACTSRTCTSWAHVVRDCVTARIAELAMAKPAMIMFAPHHYTTITNSSSVQRRHLGSGVCSNSPALSPMCSTSQACSAPPPRIDNAPTA